MTTDYNNSSEEGNAAILQPDGKLVVVGTATNGISAPFVFRYLVDGTLDTNFGAGGKVIINFGEPSAGAIDVALQSDNKIVIAGASGNGDFALARLLANGVLDDSFGLGGKVTTDFNNTADTLSAIALQPDGKIVAAGFTSIGGNNDFAVARYNTNGSLDAGFGINGKFTLGFNTNSDEVRAIALQPDGKIVLAGRSGIFPSAVTALARLQTNGVLDTSFGIGGKVTTNASEVRDMLLQPDGKILLVGSDQPSLFLFRFLVNGTLDSGFGIGGKAALFFNSPQLVTAYSLVQQPDGKIMVGGVCSGPGGGDFCAIRTTSDGTIDLGFGINGVAYADAGASDTARVLLLLPDSNIMLVGTRSDTTLQTSDVALARLFNGNNCTYNLQPLSFAYPASGGTGLINVSASAGCVWSASPVGNTFITLTGNTSGQGNGTVSFSVSATTSTFGERSGNIVIGGQSVAVRQFSTSVPEAGPGSTDYSFDFDGAVTTNFHGVSNDRALTAILQPDGKIVLAGTAQNGFSNDFALARYNVDGSLDSGFGNGGKVVTDLTGNVDEALALALQPDGKIIVGGLATSGQSFNSRTDIALLRYLPNGVLDATFGNSGIVLTNINNLSSSCRAVAVQPDSKIMVAGTSYTGTNDDFVVLRYNADGTPDTSFSGGRVLTDFGGNTDQGNALVLQPDGKIVVAGLASPAGTGGGFGLARYNANGTPDTSFGNAGKVVVTGIFGPANALVLQLDGKLLTVGAAAVVRFLPNGLLDGSFGLNGKARMPNTFGGIAYALKLQPDGKPLIAGGSSGGTTFQVVRLLQNGAPDIGFGVEGVANVFNGSTNVGSSLEARGLVLQPDGKIYVAGTASIAAGFSNQLDFALARVNGGATCSYTISPGGQLFSGTGGSGTVTVSTETGCPWTAVVSSNTTFVTITSGATGNGSGVVNYSLPINPLSQPRSGMLTVAGRSFLIEQRGVNVPENAAGNLDSSFDGEGEVATNFFASSNETAYALATQADGRVIAAGSTENGFGRDFALVRYNPDGTPDPGFGAGGRVLTSITSLDDEAYAVDIQTDGKIIAVGSVGSGGTFSQSDWVAVRYNADGTLDSSFGIGGIAILDVGNNTNNNDKAQAVLLQSDGKIVLAGYAYANSNSNSADFVLLRLNGNGILDATFGNNGRANLDFGGQADLAYTALLLGDGKIMVGGQAQTSTGNGDFALARFNTNGTLDTTFGVNGRVLTDFDSVDTAYALALQEDGKLILAGNSNSFGLARWAAARYLPDGSLDTSFGSNGRVNLINFVGRAYSLAIQPNGSSILGGNAGGVGNQKFNLARLNLNGTVDNSFGVNGLVTIFERLFNAECRAISIQPDSKIVAAGFVRLNNSDGSDFALTRVFSGASVLSLEGRLTDSNNRPLREVAVNLSGAASRVTTTDANGNYSFKDLKAGGDYTVKSNSPAYLTTPARRDFSNLAASQTGVNFTAEAAVLPPVITPLTDDFNGARDVNKWSVGALTRAGNSFDAATAVAQSNGQLVITPRANVPDAHFNGYTAVNNFDFTNGAASVELVQAANGGGETGFAVGTGPEFYFRFAVLPFNANPSQPEGNAPAAESPLLVMQVRNSGQFKLLSVPYNPGAHRFLRLRHVPETIPPPASNASPGGYVVFAASAANPINYTELFRIALGPRSVAQMSVELSAGTSNPVNTPGQAIFDNFAATSNSSAQFMTSSFTASEGSGQVAVTVTRTGDTSGGAAVEYATAGGTAQSGSRYIYTSGTLTFAPNETSKNFSVPLIDNVLVDGTQTVEVLLSNARGAALNSPARAILTITDNDTPGATNAIEDAQFFVRQQYFDFLNREPDAAGLDYWTGQITTCGADAACLRSRRISVSAAFFVELEFQETGYVVYRFYRAAFGSMTPPNQTRANIVFDEFTRDRSQIIAGPLLEQSTREFAERFIQREQFTAAYPLTMTNAQFVNKLFDTANLTPFATERQAEIDAMNNTGRTRAQVLFNVINLPAFRTREYNPSFVLMQYFGYLRRDPDQGGYDFWLNILNQQPANARGMVCAFITSAEYQLRFGTQTPRSNMECGPGV